jgi:type II secretory pathway component PulJ
MTTKRNNKGFTLILVALAIVLVGSAVAILSQMSRDILFDAKQARRQAIQRDETVSRRMLDHQNNSR